MKFGIFYEHQLPRPWDDGQRAPAHPGRARPGRAGRQARLRRTCGRSSTTSSRSTRHSSAPEVFLAARQPAHEEHPPRPRHHPDRAAATTTRPAPPSASPCSTSCRTAGSSSAPASRRPRPSSAASASTRSTKREQWLEGLEVALRCMTETPFTGVDGKFVHDAAPQRRAQAGAEAAPAAVGRVLAPRHDPPRRREGHRRADASRSSTPRRPSTGSTDYDATLAERVRAGRRGGQPATSPASPR